MPKSIKISNVINLWDWAQLHSIVPGREGSVPVHVSKEKFYRDLVNFVKNAIGADIIIEHKNAIHLIKDQSIADKRWKNFLKQEPGLIKQKEIKWPVIPLLKHTKDIPTNQKTLKALNNWKNKNPQNNAFLNQLVSNILEQYKKHKESPKQVETELLNIIKPFQIEPQNETERKALAAQNKVFIQALVEKLFILVTNPKKNKIQSLQMSIFFNWRHILPDDDSLNNPPTGTNFLLTQKKKTKNTVNLQTPNEAYMSKGMEFNLPQKGYVHGTSSIFGTAELVAPQTVMVSTGASALNGQNTSTFNPYFNPFTVENDMGELNGFTFFLEHASAFVLQQQESTFPDTLANFLEDPRYAIELNNFSLELESFLRFKLKNINNFVLSENLIQFFSKKNNFYFDEFLIEETGQLLTLNRMRDFISRKMVMLSLFKICFGTFPIKNLNNNKGEVLINYDFINPYEGQKTMSILLPFLWAIEFKHIVSNLFIILVNEDSSFKPLFKQQFILFLKDNGVPYGQTSLITVNQIGLAKIFFQKSSIINLGWLLIRMFHPSLIIKAPREVYFLLKAISNISYQKNTFYYLVALMDKIRWANKRYRLERLSINEQDLLDTYLNKQRIVKTKASAFCFSLNAFGAASSHVQSPLKIIYQKKSRSLLYGKIQPKTNFICLATSPFRENLNTRLQTINILFSTLQFKAETEKIKTL